MAYPNTGGIWRDSGACPNAFLKYLQVGGSGTGKLIPPSILSTGQIQRLRGPRIGTYNESGLQEIRVYRDPVKM